LARDTAGLQPPPPPPPAPPSPPPAAAKLRNFDSRTGEAPVVTSLLAEIRAFQRSPRASAVTSAASRSQASSPTVVLGAPPASAPPLPSRLAPALPPPFAVASPDWVGRQWQAARDAAEAEADSEEWLWVPSPATGSLEAPEAPAGLGRCVVCGGSRADAAFYRCGHLCACLECASSLRRRAMPCPICQAPISDVVALQFAA